MYKTSIALKTENENIITNTCNFVLSEYTEIQKPKLQVFRTDLELIQNQHTWEMRNKKPWIGNNTLNKPVFSAQWKFYIK